MPRVYLHAFLDGRDVGPKTALTYIAQLEAAMRELGVGSIATVAGRYYAMDRDKRWERIRQAYAALVLGQGERYATAAEGIASAYGRGITDEFVPPFIVAGSDGRIAAGDGVVFFNFRPDRARQLTRALSEAEFTEFARPAGALPVHFACMTQYDATLAAPVAFPQERYEDTLGQVLAARGLQQLRIAETEKYAHVTFFFNGGVETPNKGETRLLIPSPKVATYDLQPAMSACEVTAALLQELEHNKFDVVILNFANPDMVGHTGVMAAAVQAMETVDACVGRIVERILSMGGCACITADHGNLEKMLDESTGQPHTAHTTNKVPFILVGKGAYRLHGVILADIAPTLMELLGIPIPARQTGSSLLEK